MFYAHLKPGSVQVEEGDTVSAGKVLAQVGNTGNTSAPHLHVHVMDRPSAIASASIPYQSMPSNSPEQFTPTSGTAEAAAERSS